MFLTLGTEVLQHMLSNITHIRSAGRVSQMYRVSSVPAYTLQSPHPGVAAADNPQPFPWASSLGVSQSDGGVKQ